jgi:hypothetical protein
MTAKKVTVAQTQKFWTLVVSVNNRSIRRFSVRGLEYVMRPKMSEKVIAEVEGDGTPVGPRRLEQIESILESTKVSNPLEEAGIYHLGHQINRTRGYVVKVKGYITLRAVPEAEFQRQEEESFA